MTIYPKLCFKCGKPPLTVSDNEITCSDRNCFISSKSFSLSDWNDRPIGVSPEFLQSSSNILSGAVIIQEKVIHLLKSILEGKFEAEIDGMPTSIYMISLIGEVTISSSVLNMVKAQMMQMWSERGEKKE